MAMLYELRRWNLNQTTGKEACSLGLVLNYALQDFNVGVGAGIQTKPTSELCCRI